MSKKQRSKSSSESSALSSKAPSSKDTDDDFDDDHVRLCVELAVKPLPHKHSTNSNTTSGREDDVVRKEVWIHPSDAYDVDVRDGESALILRAVSASGGGDDGTNIAVVCKVRIPVPSPKPSFGSPSISKKKVSGVTVPSGEIQISPSWLSEYFLSNGGASETKATTVPTPSTISKPTIESTSTSLSTVPSASSPSPSKTKFSFAKGGGGDAMISPTQKLASPSGSKFSFANGGGGDSLTSPAKTTSASKSTAIATLKRTAIKVVLTPLTNLSKEQLNCICRNATKLLLCPVRSIDTTATLKSHDLPKNAIDKHFSASIDIIQTLLLSKYQGYHIHYHTTKGSMETLSISFKGQMESFHIIDVVSGDEQSKKQERDENELSNEFYGLSISSNDSQTKSESLLRKTLRRHSCETEDRKESGGKCIAFTITPQTQISLVSTLDCTTSPSHDENVSTTTTDLKQSTSQTLCAGLDTTLSRIRDTLIPPLLHPSLFPKDGPLRPPKGCLVFGPPGVGKSFLAAQIANDFSTGIATTEKHRIFVKSVQCADILATTTIIGEAENSLTGVFEEAKLNASDSCGSLLILDDVHLICPRRGGLGSGSGGLGVDQLAGTLLALLDGIGSPEDINTNRKSGGGVVVLAITTDPSLLDPALRRSGRLDVEVEVPVPDDKARADILRFHIASISSADSSFGDKDIEALARLAKGFTGADCKLAVKEAVRSNTTRSLESGKQATGVEYNDLEHAIRITKPTAIKSVAIEIPRVPWSAIGGMDQVKSLLKESIELPLTHPHLFEMMQVPPPKGILLYGPPGCSKTLMARAIATEGNMNFLAVKGPELLSKWLGESERALASLFRRARLASPAVIFFDECDAIASKRGGGGGGGSDRLLSQLLTELDGVTSGGEGGNKSRVVVVGATNRPDVLDPALTRPGRMDRMIYVGLPDENGRKSIFDIGLKGKQCHEDVDVSVLAKDDLSKGYSGAEIVAICRDAALHAIGEMDDGFIDAPQIRMQHLLRSITDMKPRTTPEMLSFYESFRRH